MANKTVMSLDLYCEKCKKVALNSVTKIDGIDSLSIDMNERTLTVIGDADPVGVANLLRRKFRCAKLLSAEPVPPPPPPPPPSPPPPPPPPPSLLCYPPFPVCSYRPDILWPRYQHPCAPSEVVYVWNEEKQDLCTIM